MTAWEVTLRERQLWFAEAVTTPEAEPGVSATEAQVALTSGPRLTALERLDIYRRGYHSRLVECLADDYPVLKHALGAGSFKSLCRAYIAAFPSEAPSLNDYGRHVAAFCTGEAPEMPVPQAFAADLAALEWAIVEVIHARSTAPLTLERLAGVAPEAWPGARLVVNPALRVVRAKYPVEPYFRAVREGTEPPVPAPEASATAVYRVGPTVWRMGLTPAMADVLEALVAGEVLSSSLARAEPALAHLNEDDASQLVMRWFRDWVSSGLFQAVQCETEPRPA